MKTIILDTETTGTVPPIEVIEVAYNEIDFNFNIVDSFHQFFKPSIPISLGAKAAHHIFEEDLENCAPSSSFVFPADVEYIIGQNIDYDLKALGIFEERYKTIDTLPIARTLFPKLDSHTQTALLYYFEGVDAREMIKEAHSAKADIIICQTILAYLLNENLVNTGEMFHSWEEIHLYSERCRIPSVMSFGKWKGYPIKDVPRDYVQWLAKQPDVDPYLLRAFESVKR